MSSSLWSGHVNYNSLHVHNDHPARTFLLLNAANNVLHLADESAQQIVSYMATESDGGLTLPGTGSPDTTLFARYGPFDLRFHAESGGTPFKMRVRLGALETATADQVVRAVLTTPAFAELDRDDAGDNTADFTVTGGTTSLQWYDSNPKILTVDTDLQRYSQVDERLRVDAKTGYSDSYTETVQITPFWLYLYAVSTNPTTTVKVGAFYAAEYTGT